MISKNDFLKLNCSENENQKKIFKLYLKNNVKELILNINNIEEINSFKFYVLLRFKFNNFICLYYSIKLMKDVQVNIVNSISNDNIRSITFDFNDNFNVNEIIVKSLIIFSQLNIESKLSLKVNTKILGLIPDLINFILIDHVTNIMLLNYNNVNIL